MTAFTRLTVVGSGSRAEVVVPSDEPVASVSSALLELLGEEPGTVRRPVALVRVLGDQVDPLLTLAEQGVLDGEVVRVVRSDQAPPPPEVADVTDVVSDAFDERRDRWGRRSRLAVAAATVLPAAVVLAAVTADVIGDAATGVLASIATVLLALSILCGRLARRDLSVLTAAVGLGAALVSVVELARILPEGTAPAALPFAGIVVWIALGSCFGVGSGERSVRWAALAGIALWAVSAALLFAPVPLAVAAGIVATIGVVAVGRLPWYALSTSGLTGLDDGTAAGRLPRRAVVHETLVQAYRSLDWATAAIAAPLGVAIVVLVLQDDVFAFCLGVAATLVVALRTRTFPLALQGIVLWITVIAAAAAVAMSPFPPDGVRLLVVGGVLVLAIVLATVRPVAHVRVRLRRWGNALELLAMVAVVPLLLGLFGVYADLLEAFPAP